MTRASFRSSARRISSAISTFSVLPPLFPFIRDFYNVSYTQLGLALTAFNITTALCQTPAGLPGRPDRRALRAGGGDSCSARRVSPSSGSFPSFWLLVAMFALLGVANGVYHPADYAILSQLVSNEARRARRFRCTSSRASSAPR
jgi:MFS family permease